MQRRKQPRRRLAQIFLRREIDDLRAARARKHAAEIQPRLALLKRPGVQPQRPARRVMGGELARRADHTVLRRAQRASQHGLDLRAGKTARAQQARRSVEAGDDG